MTFEDLMKLPEFDKFTAAPEDGDYDAHVKVAMKAVFEYKTVDFIELMKHIKLNIEMEQKLAGKK